MTRAGNQAKHGNRDPKEPVAEAAKWGEAIYLAVPYENVQDAVETIGSAAEGKILVDVTNVVGQGMTIAVGLSTSVAEERQKLATKARVVKAFNSFFPE